MRKKGITDAAVALLLVGLPSCQRCDPARVSRQGYLTADRPPLSDDTPPAARPFDEALRAACGDGGLTELGEERISRWPYLQQVTSRGAHLLWTSPASRPARVRISSPEGHSPPSIQETSSNDSPTQRLADIRGLEPGSIYCYEISGTDGAWTRPTGFKTAPADATGSVQFVALADVGRNTPDQRAVRSAFFDVESDLIIFAGDIAYRDGSIGDFEDNFFAIYRDYLGHIPLFPASGNHEYHTDNAQPYLDVFSLPRNGAGDDYEGRWYAFDWGPAHFVILDTEIEIAKQAAWLDEDLALNELPFVVAVLHRPPYASGYHGPNLEVRRHFTPVFERHRVQLVLSGHEHHYERSKPIHGVTYVISGGGGAGTRPVTGSETTAVAERVAHFLHVQVDTQELRLRAIDASGNIFDTLRLPPR